MSLYKTDETFVPVKRIFSFRACISNIFVNFFCIRHWELFFFGPHSRAAASRSHCEPRRYLLATVSRQGSSGPWHDLKPQGYSSGLQHDLYFAPTPCRPRYDVKLPPYFWQTRPTCGEASYHRREGSQSPQAQTDRLVPAHFPYSARRVAVTPRSIRLGSCSNRDSLGCDVMPRFRDVGILLPSWSGSYTQFLVVAAKGTPHFRYGRPQSGAAGAARRAGGGRGRVPGGADADGVAPVARDPHAVEVEVGRGQVALCAAEARTRLGQQARTVLG